MTDEQVIKAWETAKSRVVVSCDENHAHSAKQGCLSPRTAGGLRIDPIQSVPGLVGSVAGDARDITICILAETLLDERKLIREVLSKIGNT